MIDRVIVFVVGVLLILSAWRMTNHEFWTTEGARQLLRERPSSRLRQLNLRVDVCLTRTVVPLLLVGLGIVALIVAVLGLLD